MNNYGYNLFLINKRYNAIVIQEMNTNWYSQTFKSEIKKFKNILNSSELKLYNLFQFCQNHCLHTRLYKFIKFYVSLPKRKKLFFKFFKIEIYRTNFYKKFDIKLWFLKQYWNIFLLFI